MNMSRSCCWLALVALSLSAVASEDSDSSHTIFSGFGTLGGVYNSNDDHGFVLDLGQETPPGRQYSWRTDARLGVQVAHTFNPQWSAVGQALLRDQVENTLNSSITRAFVSYRPGPNLHLRLGRMADATFLISDFQDVGYVYPWVRPPMESYSLIAPRFFDGGDVTYSLPDATGVWRIKGLAGRVKAAITTGIGYDYTLEGNDLRGLALIREQGPLKARIGYSRFHIQNPAALPSQLTAGLNQIATDPGVVAFYPDIATEALAHLDALNSLEGAQINYASAGFAYDDGRWVAQVEVSDLSSNTKIFPKGQQGYASVGYRIGDFMPYVMIGGSRSPAAAKAVTSWEAALGAAAGSLQSGALAARNAQRSEQSSLSLGVRWDFNDQAALKLQWDHVRVRDHGWGVWSSRSGSDGAAGSANLLTATVDFVF